MIQPLQHVKEHDKSKLQPTQNSARVKVLEKDTILKDSETGKSYNTKKFLQEYELPPFSRNEPLNIMSNENQNLTNVKLACGLKSQKSVSFSDEVTVAQSDAFGTPVRIISAPTRMNKYNEESKENRSPEEGIANTAQYKSTHALWGLLEKEEEEKAPWLTSSQLPVRASSFILPQESSTGPTMARSPRRRAYSSLDTEYKDEFSSHSTNVVPSNLKYSLNFASSYGNQFPNYSNLGYKHDSRLLWEPGHGAPRPQTKLLDVQDSFNKTELRKRFHSTFCETNPDLRENIINGKKHTFYGVPSASLHG